MENAQTLAPVPKLSLSHNHWVPGAQGLSAAGIPLGSHAGLPGRAQQLLAHPSVSSCFDWPSSRSPDRRNLRIKQFSSCHHAPAEYLAGELMWLSETWRGSYLGSWRTLFRSRVTVAMRLCHECVPYLQDFYWTHFPWTGDRWWRTKDRASPVKRLHEPVRVLVGEKGHRETMAMPTLIFKIKGWYAVLSYSKINDWNFLSGLVVENPPANAGDMSSIPGPGKSRKISHVMEQLSPLLQLLKPILREASTMREAQRNFSSERSLRNKAPTGHN